MYQAKWRVWDIGSCALLIVSFSIAVLSIDTWILKSVELPFLLIFDLIGIFSIYLIFLRRKKIQISHLYNTHNILFLPIFIALQLAITITRVGVANGFEDVALIYTNLWSLVLTDFTPHLLENASAIFLSPVWEEFLFRGVVFFILAKKLGYIPAMIIPSLVFALLHIDPNYLANMNVTIFSTVLLIFVESLLKSYLVYRTRSLTIPTAMHIFGNALSTIIAIIYAKLGFVN